MKKKKGFVFVETLIVVAVLTASLLMLYSTYSALIRKEKTRITYNDSVYLYRTYYLEKFFRNFRLDSAKKELNEDTTLLTAFWCPTISINGDGNLGLCESLIEELHIRKMYLTYNNLSALQNCQNQSGGLCETLNQVGNDKAAAYLKTIGGKGTSGYRIIIEFAETKEGSKCNDEDCVYYYTTLSLGEIE